jgi:hypothetical protein
VTSPLLQRVKTGVYVLVFAVIIVSALYQRGTRIIAEKKAKAAAEAEARLNPPPLTMPPSPALTEAQRDVANLPSVHLKCKQGDQQSCEERGTLRVNIIAAQRVFAFQCQTGDKRSCAEEKVFDAMLVRLGDAL